MQPQALSCLGLAATTTADIATDAPQGREPCLRELRSKSLLRNG